MTTSAQGSGKKGRGANQVTTNGVLTISGYKSISRPVSITLSPLTILAGSNSSGKSSVIQPLLLIKQTLEAVYDPGAILLDGPNLKITSTDQIFSRISNPQTAQQFSVELAFPNRPLQKVRVVYRKSLTGLDVKEMYVKSGARAVTISADATRAQALKLFKRLNPELHKEISKGDIKAQFSVARRRSFLTLQMFFRTGKKSRMVWDQIVPGQEEYENTIRSIIHVPGVRGRPTRTYNVSEIGTDFPGSFENYVASIIARWQRLKRKELKTLESQLDHIGLTSRVAAKRVDDTQIELQVGRLLKGRAKNDLVNISDVGFGVSQVLPVLVALIVAKPGQIVYLEQPELHLHPRAQLKLADLIVEAAKRKQIIVIETHSRMILLRIQTLVAEGKISSEQVKLHWFKRDSAGSTRVSGADLDEFGAFGNWPEDFADVDLRAQSDYLDASIKKS